MREFITKKTFDIRTNCKPQYTLTPGATKALTIVPGAMTHEPLWRLLLFTIFTDKRICVLPDLFKFKLVFRQKFTSLTSDKVTLFLHAIPTKSIISSKSEKQGSESPLLYSILLIESSWIWVTVLKSQCNLHNLMIVLINTSSVLDRNLHYSFIDTIVRL